MFWGYSLGIAAAITWGSGDFFGGLLSKRLETLAVVFWSQLAGGLTVLVIAYLASGPLTGPDIVFGVIAGCCGALGLLLFYRGLAVGMMSLVAPIAAGGAIIPLIAAAMRGEIPPMFGILGAIIALIGIGLASIITQAEQQETIALQSRWQRFLRTGIPHAIGAAIAFGLFLTFIGIGSRQPHASPLWIIACARLGGLLIVIPTVLLGRRSVKIPWKSVGGVAVVGLFDTSANVLFAIGSTLGNPGIVSVLSSLYPVTTVILASIILRERLSKLQLVGVALTLLGVIGMAAG